MSSCDNLPSFELAPLLSPLVRAQEHAVFYRVSPSVQPRRHGILELEADGRTIKAFEEKPANPRTNLCATSMYVLCPEVLGHLETYLGAGGERDAPGHFLEWLVPRVRVRGVRCPGPLYDAGSLEGLARARAALRT